MKSAKMGRWLAALVLTAACTSTKEEKRDSLRADLASTLAVNESAKGHEEWESSVAHPESTFWKWAREHQSPEDVCPALLELSDEKLSLFEEEIKLPEYLHLVSTCREEIQTRLEKYWKEKTAELENVNMDFQFQEETVVRDFTEGLFLVSGDLKPRQVVFTFDDGPSASYTDQILRTLALANVKAIFFQMGRSVRANPDQVRHVGAAGHMIGSHSITHRCIAFKKICEKNNRGHMLSYAEAINEIQGAHQMIYNILGWVDPYFRFPFGESSTELKTYLAKNSMGEFYWSIDSNDWRAQSPAHLVQSVMRDLNARGRGIILFHDIQRRTMEALPLILRKVYDGGFEPVLIVPSDAQARYHNKLVIQAQ